MKNSKFFEAFLDLFLRFKTEKYNPNRKGFNNFDSYILNNQRHQKDLAVYPTKDGKILFNTLKEMLKKGIELTEENLLIQLNQKKHWRDIKKKKY